ncbi:MAG: alpha/beta fold hydrolase, partial [Planctomycetota bacterium]
MWNRLLPAAFAGLALATLSLGAPARGPFSGGLTVDAGRGPITVSLPANYDPASPAPLVVLLHGFGASGPVQEAYMQFTPIQDDYGYVFCAPSGTVNGAGQRFWNATNACCDFQNSNVDDVGYLVDLIEAIEAAVSIDPRSIHLVGHSNGGFMSYRMACERSDKIASIASLAGATFSDPADCVGSGPVHILQIHGTNDATIAYGGGA